jgi:hypothetical protein
MDTAGAAGCLKGAYPNFYLVSGFWYHSALPDMPVSDWRHMGYLAPFGFGPREQRLLSALSFSRRYNLWFTVHLLPNAPHPD